MADLLLFLIILFCCILAISIIGVFAFTLVEFWY